MSQDLDKLENDINQFIEQIKKILRDQSVPALVFTPAFLALATAAAATCTQLTEDELTDEFRRILKTARQDAEKRKPTIQ